MSKRENIVFWGVIAAICIIFIVGYVAFGVYSCEQSWPDMPHRYELVVGCMVETPQDGWIPAANYRVLP